MQFCLILVLTAYSAPPMLSNGSCESLMNSSCQTDGRGAGGWGAGTAGRAASLVQTTKAASCPASVGNATCDGLTDGDHRGWDGTEAHLRLGFLVDEPVPEQSGLLGEDPFAEILSAPQCSECSSIQHSALSMLLSQRGSACEWLLQEGEWE